MLVFDPTFFDGEVREGFYVPSLMKRCWAAQLEVLKEIEKVCKRHNLIYFAEYGTLIGAVRHKGFIPWDDDIDISMSRKDVNLFIKYAREELPEGYKVYTSKENFKEFLVRVVNTNTLSTSFSHMNRFHGFPFIAGIDIFIYDNIPNDKEERDNWLLLIAAIHSLGYDWENQEEETLEEKIEMMYELGDLCNYKFNQEESHEVQLLQLTQYLSGMYSEEETDEVATVYRLRQYPERKFPRSYIKDIIEVPFENVTIPIPRNYDEMLNKVYSNYKVGVKGNYGHDYPYYKEQQKMFLKAMEEKNIKLPDYFYEEAKYE